MSIRFGEVELMRFLAAMMVLNVHTRCYAGCGSLVPGGYLGVEFFFLLSGYLMASQVHKQATAAPLPAQSTELWDETYRYLWRRLCSFWPELFIACCIGLGVFAWGHHFAVQETLSKAYDTLMGNLLLLHMTSLAPWGVNVPTWYLSALLLSSAALYPMFRRFGHSPIWIVFALALLGYATVADEKAATQGFAGVARWMGWTLKGNLRAFAELTLGFSLFPLVQHIARINVSRRLSLGLTVLKWGCYGIAFFYCLHPNGRYLTLALCALACALVLCFSRHCIDRNLYQHGWIMWLGRFSLPLYLSHYFWAGNLARILPFLTLRWEKILVYHFVAGVTALIVMFLAKHMRSALKNIR